MAGNVRLRKREAGPPRPGVGSVSQLHAAGGGRLADEVGPVVVAGLERNRETAPVRIDVDCESE